MSNMTPQDKNLNTFSLFIQHLEKGSLHSDLTDQVQECVNKIAEHAAEYGGTHKAKLTIEIEFKLNDGDRVVEVQANSKTNLPKKKRGRGGLFFCHPDGHLTLQDPRQRSFDEILERRENRENRQSF